MFGGLFIVMTVATTAVYLTTPALLAADKTTSVYSASHTPTPNALLAATDDKVTNGIRVSTTDRGSGQNRTFRLNAHAPEFLLDGRPFRFIGGAFNYFRSLPGSWQRKLRTMRAAGLNVLTTYVEWSLHNPNDGVYTFEGAADVVRFIRLAEAEGFLVVLRPGPYICAERDAGGFPYWLLTKYPQIRLRTMDADYVREVQRWYAELMPRMWPLLYENGGPVIMVQVENEYGSFKCNMNYRRWMHETTERHVRGKALLFTTDGPAQTKCGKIPGVLATVDFGPDDATSVDSYWALLRRYEPTGPLVNMEYYPGWFTHWQEPSRARVATAPVVRTLRQMLAQNASVAIYMFYGGTSFGFTAGANNFGPGKYDADQTSYDFDAPMDESGDPTAKYHALRAVISEYLPLPDIPVPQPLPKWRRTEPVQMRRVAELLAPTARRHLGTRPVHSHRPNVSFEQLNQHSGFVLYETPLPAAFKTDPAVLHVDTLHDRAVVLVDGVPVGLLSREQCVADVALPAALAGGLLQVLVENQGRINYDVAEDFKGILGQVQLAGVALVNWTLTGYPLESYRPIESLVAAVNQAAGDVQDNRPPPSRICAPTVYRGTFDVDSNERLYDTYLDPRGWGKGVAFVNSFNVGRYWPLVGPQRTLYVPVELLRHGGNEVTLVELERCAVGATVTLVDKPILD